MIARSTSILLLLLLAATSPAQQRVIHTSRKVPDPATLHGKWKWFQKHKDVTGQYPTTYETGGVYRLKQDVVVQFGGTFSKVSQYWVSAYRSDEVERVKKRLRDPEGTKEREIRALQELAGKNQKLAGTMDIFIDGIRDRQEDEQILSEGTTLRFGQIWLQRSFEMGVSVNPYVQILNGPLKGKWLGILFLSECGGYRNYCCDPKPEYLEYVGK